MVSLKVTDIDSKRMMLRVEQGKGRKDRYAMLSPVLLELLRDWYRIARPQGWLFPGQNPVNPMTTRQLTRACQAAAHMAEITKRVTPRRRSQPTLRATSGAKGLMLDGWSTLAPPTCSPPQRHLPSHVDRRPKSDELWLYS